MAEEIKQLVNQNFTGSDITNNNQIELISNNASTTSVVREIFVTDSDIGSADAKLFIDNNNIEVLNTFENAEGTLVIAPSQNLTVKFNTDITPGTKTTVTMDVRDWNQRGAGNTNSNYDTISQVISFSGTDSTYSLLSSAGTEGSTITNGTFNSSGNWTTGLNAAMASGTQYEGFKIGATNAAAYFRKDSNSTFAIYYNNSQVVSRSYGSGAVDYVNNRIFYKDGGTIKMFDPSISTSAVYSVASNMPSTQSTYAVGGVQYDDDGDLYYFFLYSTNLRVRNITDYGNLTGSGSANSDTVYKTISGLSGSNGASRVCCVAYNDTEEKFYVFHMANTWSSNENGLVTFTKANYNATSDTGDITHTDVKTGGSQANSVWSLFSSDHQNEARTTHCYMAKAHGEYIIVPATDTEAYIYKCENDALTFIAKITGLDDPGTLGTNNRIILPKYSATRAGDITPVETSFTTANYDIEARVNIQGVEIT